MDCPACGKGMVEEDFGGVMVDVCKDGCKGMWFDWGELVRLDETNEGLGKALEEAVNSSRVNDENRGQIACPKCGILMQEHKYQSAKAVSVDECYGCGGFFLDSGEIGEIRENFMSEQERDVYCEQILEGMPEYQKMKEDQALAEKRLEAAKKYCLISRMLGRFKK